MVSADSLQQIALGFLHVNDVRHAVVEVVDQFVQILLVWDHFVEGLFEVALESVLALLLLLDPLENVLHLFELEFEAPAG